MNFTECQDPSEKTSSSLEKCDLQRKVPPFPVLSCRADFKQLHMTWSFSGPCLLPSRVPQSQSSQLQAILGAGWAAQDKGFFFFFFFLSLSSFIIQPLFPECWLCPGCHGASLERDAQTAPPPPWEAASAPSPHHDWVSFFP